MIANGSAKMVIYANSDVKVNGQLGIGDTPHADSKLDIAHATNAGGDPTHVGTIRLHQFNFSGTGTKGGIEFKTSGSGNGYGAKVYSNAGSDSFGIATRSNSASWTERFKIAGSTGYISTTSRVGIGTDSPISSLHVQGNVIIKDSGEDTSFIVEGPTGYDAKFLLKSDAGGALADWWEFRADIDQKLYIKNGNTELHAFTSDGKVGINCTDPAEKLEVRNGHLAVTEGYDMHLRRDGGMVRWTANGLSSGTNYGEMYMSATGTMNWSIGGTNRMSLTSNGVDVANIYTPSIVAGGGSNMNIMASGQYLDLKADYDSTSGSIRFFPTNQVQKMVLDRDGNLGIGTNSPGSRLDLANGYMVKEQSRQNHISNTLQQPYYWFDGVDDYIDIGAVPIDEEPFSIFCWISIDGYSAGNKFMFGNAGTVAQAFGLYASGSTYKLRFEATGTGTQVNGSEDIPHDGTWHFVGVTLQKDGTLQFYVDGVASGGTSSYAKSYTASDDYYIGRDRTAYFKGGIVNLSVHNLALSASEVKELYSGASVPFKYKEANSTNLVSNGTLASNITGWGVRTGAGTAPVNSHDSGVGNTANGSIKVVLASDSANCGVQMDTTYIASEVGKDYYLSAWIYQASGSTKQFYVGFYDNLAWQYVAEFADVPTGVWTQLSGYLNLKKTHSQGTIRIISGNAGAAHTYWIDDIVMHRVGAVAEYDGSGSTESTWYDKSNNNLDGTISGTQLENSKGIGPLRFSGNKVGIGDKNPIESFHIRNQTGSGHACIYIHVADTNNQGADAKLRLGNWQRTAGVGLAGEKFVISYGSDLSNDNKQ